MLSPEALSNARALVAELDALADRAQALFDDASAAAYARPASNDLDHLDGLYDAAQHAADAPRRIRAALGI